MRNVTISLASEPSRFITTRFTKEITGKELLKLRGLSLNPWHYQHITIQIDFELKDLTIVHIQNDRIGTTFRLKDKQDAVTLSVGRDMFSIKSVQE